jgi:hypothetical protein
MTSGATVNARFVGFQAFPVVEANVQPFTNDIYTHYAGFVSRR